MEAKQYALSVIGEVRKAVVGKEEPATKLLMAILARGHVLLEDMPGVGKTTMALAFSRALGLTYHRVQFTPDVMPSDLTGFSVYDRQTGELEYKPGALMCNLFLADELNRATSRTQSALLEAMEEGQVTVDGKTHPIPSPFLVLATQNPAGASGTQLLPDSQMDRFTMRLSMGYPSPREEREMLRRKGMGNPLDQVKQVLTHQQLEGLRTMVDQVYFADELADYVIEMVNRTRRHPRVIQGASPRATLAVSAVARACAFLHGRDYVVPEDIHRVWVDTVAHRLVMAPGADTGIRLAEEILAEVQPPRIR